MILSNFGLGLDGSVLVFSTLLLGSSFRVSLESRKPSPKTGQSKPYEDEDGTATEESQKAYSVRTQNFLLIAVSALGFSAALVESVLATLHSWTLSNNVWINFAVWAIVVAQTAFVVIEHRPVFCFLQAARTAGSFIFCSFPPVYLIYSILNDDLSGTTKVQNYLEGSKLALALCGFTICASYPRRPDVFLDGRPVDGVLTVSAWSRFTYEWKSKLMAKAGKGEKLEFNDLSILDHNIRSGYLYKRYESIKTKGSFVTTVLKCHLPSIAVQYGYTTADSIFNLAPQVALYKLLQLLQQRDDGADITKLGSFWIVVLFIVQILGAFFFGRMWFSGESYVQVPMRLQIPALIFAKSMRKKDVKGAKKKEAKEIIDGNESEESSLIKNGKNKEEDAEVDETDELKKSRQGVVNLVGVDSKRIADFTMLSNLIFGAVIKLVIAFYFLYEIVGWQALLVGISVQVLFLPLNIYFSKKYTVSQDMLMKARDRKLATVNEALTGIRQIKFAALEQKWQKKIMATREAELKNLWLAMVADVILISLWIAGPVLLSAGCIATHAIIYGSLEPATAFTTVSLLSRIEGTLAYLPELITNGLDAWVSAKRVSEYLLAPEKEFVAKDGNCVAFENTTISWPADEVDDETFKLHNVNIEFPNGELSVISGRTGSGKSLLLSAILGECEVLSGSITIPKSPSMEERNDKAANKGNWILANAVAFVPQIPWIENCSLRDNILFGLPYDEDRYQQVIDSCAMTKDLEILVDGDMTEIGPNGINLSGGQCWRLTLARALYSRAGILVLDDIFSAVDAHVGKHIYEKALTGSICDGRTRILVTHHVALCRPNTTYEVHLGSGGVEFAGNVEDMERSMILKTMLDTEEEAINMDSDDDVERTMNSEDVQRRLSTVSRKLSRSSTRGSALSGFTGKRRQSKVGSNHPTLEEEPAKKSVTYMDPKKFVEEEQRETGRVRTRIYLQYLQACGGFWFWVVVMVLFLGFEALLLGRSWVLRLWTRHHEVQSLWSAVYSKSLVEQNSYLKPSKYTITEENFRQTLYFWVSLYLGISIFMVLEGTLRYLVVFSGSIKASRNMFEQLTYAVLRAPLRWLDTVPVGRVLNRFTADFNMFDMNQAYGLSFMFWNFLQVIGVAIAGAVVSPWIILTAAVLFVVCLYFAMFYLAAARDTRRLESTAKSPIFEHFNAALQGVSTIRAFERKETYVQAMFDKLDEHARTLYHLSIYKRWLGWRLAIVGSIFTGIGACFILAFRGMDAALGGFALTFMLAYNDSIFWLLRHFVEVELGMNSTERIVEYAEMEIENQDGKDVPASWPSTGRMEVNNLVVSYAPDLPPVLKGLTFEIQSNERVGVVGRTGAGKSSLTLAIFRFLEAREGSITVDGIDISTIKLADLRSRLAIIPQDPVLFSGTVRSNLDPFDEHSDAELRDALARVHLTDEENDASPQPSGSTTPGSPTQQMQRNTNTNIFRSLTSAVAESGQNLSQGQRQLLCLARAIVARPKIMVLDEATSAVDKTTDSLIQRSIREEFNESTLLVIAHRLSTIADFDQILVLDDGLAVEYGTPKELIAIKDGVFAGMVESSGERDTLVGIINS